MQRYPSLPFVVVFMLAACSSNDRGKGGDGATADATSEDDVFFPGAGDGTGPGEDVVDTHASPDGDTQSGQCATFGCACGSNADCLDELCIEGPDGRVCSSPCVTECPDAGFACVPIALGGFGPLQRLRAPAPEPV